MAASVYESPLFAKLFPTGEVGRLFTDTAELRAMLLVEGTLAKVQGEAGIIPTDSAAFIHRSAMELQVDPAGLAEATGQNGVCVPALVTAFRKEMEAPDHAQFVHWGATSQDIIDTGLMLRLRQTLTLIERDLTTLASRLADLAAAHAETPLPARTWGQHATPTSFGAVVASWGQPVLDLLDDLPDLRRKALVVSLSGAAGTGAELGPDPSALRAALARGLGLGDPGHSWHSTRRPILLIANWLSEVTSALAKMGTDVTAMARTELAEVRLGSSGASSTMPQKQNPVRAELLGALARQSVGLLSVLHAATPAQHQRDGAAWFSEWMSLPQLVLGAASAATVASELASGLEPDVDQMAHTLGLTNGLIHAEALSFALAKHMPRPEAQAAVKTLCAAARQSGQSLRALVMRDHPEIDLGPIFDPARTLGTAPEDARGFAQRVKDSTG